MLHYIITGAIVGIILGAVEFIFLMRHKVGVMFVNYNKEDDTLKYSLSVNKDLDRWMNRRYIIFKVDKSWKKRQ